MRTKRIYSDEEEDKRVLAKMEGRGSNIDSLRATAKSFTVEGGVDK